MGSPKPETSIEPLIDQILGYLNFGSGKQDNKFLANLNLLFKAISDQSESPSQPENQLECIRQLLTERLNFVAKQNR